MKDRVVEHPNRYVLLSVDGQADTYDLIPKPGTITEPGTPINKATLLKDETALKLGLTEENANVDKMLSILAERANRFMEIRGTPSYLAFVTNASSTSVEAAFGKNNSERVAGIGLALAMYARYFTPSLNINTTFSNLLKCETLNEICSNNAALIEACSNSHIVNLIGSNDYAKNMVTFNSNLIAVMKKNKSVFQVISANANFVNTIRDNNTTRATFNRNRIRLLAPGAVSWTVPNDWPSNFVHIQLIGGGGMNAARTRVDCGEYVQAFINVNKGQTLTGSIALGGNTTFGGYTARVGEGAQQSGVWLVKASDGGNEGKSSTYSYLGGKGGFEGGSGQNGKNSPRDYYLANGNSGTAGVGDGTLGECEGTGGTGTGYDTASNGGGGGRIAGNYSSGGTIGPGGGGGYGGGPVYSIYTGGSKPIIEQVDGITGGSGAIIITCPNDYIPQNVVYNTIGGVTAWRRDTNIFNSF